MPPPSPALLLAAVAAAALLPGPGLAAPAPKPRPGPLDAAQLAELQRQAEHQHWTFEVGPNSATNRSLAQLCGLEVPPNVDELVADNTAPPAVEAVNLPINFDWRVLIRQYYHSDVPVRDQGNCGSCWAFATVGPLEMVLKILTGVTQDLAEQFLLSCARNFQSMYGYGAYSCAGGWFVHDMHKWPGAYREASYPYVAKDTPCNTRNLAPVFRLTSWNYVAQPANLPGQVEAIKQAIWRWGPVAVAVAVDRPFQAYKGGIFNVDTSLPINHAVTVVGWGVQNNVGYWIVRNSWGPNWGEGGYMRIKWGICKVGKYANFIVQPHAALGHRRLELGAPPAAAPAAPEPTAAPAVAAADVVAPAPHTTAGVAAPKPPPPTLGLVGAAAALLAVPAVVLALLRHSGPRPPALTAPAPNALELEAPGQAETTSCPGSPLLPPPAPTTSSPWAASLRPPTGPFAA